MGVKLANGLLLLGGVVAVIYMANNTSDRPVRAQASASASTAAPCPGGAGMAFVMSQNFVKRELRSPSTASFPRTSQTTEIGECKFRVRSHFDAQNAFGAMIRSNYSAVMEYLPASRTWRGTEIRID